MFLDQIRNLKINDGGSGADIDGNDSSDSVEKNSRPGDEVDIEIEHTLEPYQNQDDLHQHHHNGDDIEKMDQGEDGVDQDDKSDDADDMIGYIGRLMNQISDKYGHNNAIRPPPPPLPERGGTMRVSSLCEYFESMKF